LTVVPSGANFVLACYDGNSRELWQRLAARGVLIRDVSSFHPRLEHCLRITVGTAEENDALLAALRDSLLEVAP
jgi:histidinol-phosphate aminotransferase